MKYSMLFSLVLLVLSDRITVETDGIMSIERAKYKGRDEAYYIYRKGECKGTAINDEEFKVLKSFMQKVS